MKSYINKALSSTMCGLALILSATSCVGDLDLKPNDPNLVSDITVDNLQQVYAKCYAGIATSGSSGAGSSDISGLDNGTGQYTRAIFMLNEYTTDECKFIWADPGIPELCYSTYGADNSMIYGAYSRLYTHIAICNDFLRTSEGFNDSKVAQWRLEVRALRAMSYYWAIDLFGNASFTDETDVAGSAPVQKTRLELYNWLVDELQSIITGMKEINATPEYGAVGLDGVEALLARLYLNANVYAGVSAYDKCATLCQEIIARHQGGGFNGSGLANHYLYLFSRSNKAYMPGGTNSAENEILWGVPYDATDLQTYGGTTFIIKASITTSNATDEFTMAASDYGVTGGWTCIHATPEFADKFSNDDIRWSMWKKEDSGFTKENGANATDYAKFNYGYAAVKFTNLIAGTNGEWSEENGGIYANDGTPANVEDFCSTDLPLLRLADVYLMYAECNIVGGAGNASDALTYANYVRQRAGLRAWNAGDLTADNILDERCRELYWEMSRRSDLIRFGKYTGSAYNWSWKGGSAAGSSIDSYRSLMPIPTNVLAAQPTFKQNQGYN